MQVLNSLMSNMKAFLFSKITYHVFTMLKMVMKLKFALLKELINSEMLLSYWRYARILTFLIFLCVNERIKQFKKYDSTQLK